MAILRLRRPKQSEPLTNPLDPSLLSLLNRDQRTILTIDRKTRHEHGDFRRVELDLRLGENANGAFAPKKISCPGGFNYKSRSRSRGPQRRLETLMCRLGEVFIVGVCLLTVVRVPTVMSAPSTRHAKANEQIRSHEQTEDILSYLHPCGRHLEEKRNNTDYKQMASKEIDPDHLSPIILRAKNTLAYAESFRDRYVWKTFDLPFEMHHRDWVNHRYEWLPDEVSQIPKRLGKEVSLAHLNSRPLDQFLLNIYEYLQKFAVGLEQVVADQRRNGGEFVDNFRKLEIHLRSVLCEIHEVMIERNIPRDPVPRTIMPDDIRHLESASYRNIRDWCIFRDLMNGLEYVIQVLTFVERSVLQSLGPESS